MNASAVTVCAIGLICKSSDQEIKNGSYQIVIRISENIEQLCLSLSSMRGSGSGKLLEQILNSGLAA